MANVTLIVIMVWVCFGVMWASLHDSVNTTMPLTFPTATEESSGTWSVMLWVWNFMPLMIGLNVGLAAYKTEGSFAMQAVSGAIKRNVILFVVVTMIILLWLSTYNFTVHTLPDTLTSLHIQAAPDYWLTMYNSALLAVMLGLIIIVFVSSL